ncbi:RNA recognition motif containing protein [Nitzschia inconspicua]|uniref:RNA recognition motif containing protein n=1 Tax=Nitzschia inconspicua TaxID=303405 RepID=A0A9K3KYH6_9STRA|nr:RNA recognition motif containing protein [Nitzschia inconspicua]
MSNAPESAPPVDPLQGDAEGNVEGTTEAWPGDNGSAISGSTALRPVFLGNLKPTYNADDIMAIFHQPIVPPGTDPGKFKPIPVDRLDQKRGYCFVFLKDAVVQEDKDNAEQFVEAISGMEVDNVSSALRAEFARGDGRVKRKEDDRRKNIQPSETLFVVNFHEDTTKREDLKMLFEPYGELVRIDMKRNYAFVQFRTVEEATRAKDVTNGGQLEGAVLTVEYVARQRSDDDRRGGGGGRFRRDDRGGGGGRFRRDDRSGGRYDRAPPGDRNDRDRDYGGRDRYDDRRGGRGGDGYRRDRSPEYRGNGGYRGERGRSPIGGAGYGRARSRSRSRSPPRYRDDRGGGYDRDRSSTRYDERDRYDEYSTGRRDSYDYGGGRDVGRGRSPEVYRGGRDDRGYRG